MPVSEKLVTIADTAYPACPAHGASFPGDRHDNSTAKKPLKLWKPLPIKGLHPYIFMH